MQDNDVGLKSSLHLKALERWPALRILYLGGGDRLSLGLGS